MEDLIIGRRLFTDGSTRTVFADDLGQYVLDDHNEKVYGVWIWHEGMLDDLPEPRDYVDKPIIVEKPQ